ncbi:MAG: hypothetical protein RMY29_029735 [Nostoc sp. CreGUA01]|nr:hypothetical protein [Nostoc sp. CreGUA01]
MANITINEIKPAGAELFVDSESFMHQLNDDEIMAIVGGAKKIYPLYNTKTKVVSYVQP